MLQNLAIDYPDRLRCCIFSNTWVKADEYITRVQTARKHIALSYGPEEYVKVSSLFTNGAMQFRYNLDKVMELERRALETVAPVEVLAGGFDMTLSHDRSADLHKIRTPSLVIGTRDDATVPVYQSEDLHKAIAGSKLVVVEEGGHYSYRRHWQEWNKIVDPFLQAARGKSVMLDPKTSRSIAGHARPRTRHREGGRPRSGDWPRACPSSLSHAVGSAGARSAEAGRAQILRYFRPWLDRSRQCAARLRGRGRHPDDQLPQRGRNGACRDGLALAIRRTLRGGHVDRARARMQAFAGSLAAASNGVGVYHIYGDETTFGEGYNMQQVPKEEQGLFGRMTAVIGQSYVLHTPEGLRDAPPPRQSVRQSSLSCRAVLSAAAAEHAARNGHGQSCRRCRRVPQLPKLAPADDGRIDQAATHDCEGDKGRDQGRRRHARSRRGAAAAGGSGRRRGLLSPGSTGVLPDAHAQNMHVGGSKGSISGNFAMAEADLLIVIGSRAVCQADCSGIGYKHAKAVININGDLADALHYNKTVALIGDIGAVADRLAVQTRKSGRYDGQGPDG